MKQPAHPLHAIVFLFCTTMSFGANVREDVRFPIDGYNIFGAPDSMLVSDNGFSFTRGDPDDSFQTVLPIDDSINYHCQASLYFGSETGDPLLNNFISSGSYPNRDHETRASIDYAGMKIPLTAAVRYRYTDNYSDRFDSIWARYGEITGREMKNKNSGLVDEVFGAAAYRSRDMSFSASVDRYEQWHATPYFFSPLHEKGLTISPRLSYTTGPVRITSTGSYRKSAWYFDHEHPVDFIDPSTTNELRFSPDGRWGGSLNVAYDNALTPAALVRCGFNYNDSLINAGMNGSVFSNFRASVDAYGKVHIGRQWCCSLAVAHDYRPKERSYYFLEYDTLVMYEPRSIERNIVSSTINWKAPAGSPSGISGWFYYNSRPRRESVSRRNDTLFIKQVADGGSTRTFLGVRGFLDIKKHYWSLSILPAMMMPLGKKENVHFFVGKTVAVRLTGTTAGTTPASATIGLNCNDRPTLNYLMTQPLGDTYEKTFTAPASASLHLSCRIPFIVPFFPKNANTGSFNVEAGPIHLTGKLRQKAHPRGNLMGPEINAGFEWIVH